MKVFDTCIYSTEKNLGKAYNEFIQMIPDDSCACLRDGDTTWLTPDYGFHLQEYVNRNPGAILTCWTNRIHKSSGQLIPQESPSDMKWHIEYAEKKKADLYKVTPLHTTVSGFCLVVPKSVWKDHKFSEVQPYEDRKHLPNLLGVDNDFTNRVRAAGIPVLRMEGLYIWHTYRLLTNSNKHLI